MNSPVEWVERGRPLLEAPPLRRGDPTTNDPKWLLGDLVAEVPAESFEDLVQVLLPYSGTTVEKFRGKLRHFKSVSEAWPETERRADATYSVHEELRRHPQRFEWMKSQERPTVDRARVDLLGRRPTRREPEPHNPEEYAEDVVAYLQDKRVSDRVTEIMRERKAVRRAQTAARAVVDDRLAQQREIRRKMRELQASVTPNRAFLEAVFRLQEYTQYVLAIGDMTSEIPEHRKSDLVAALDKFRDAVDDVLDRVAGIGAGPEIEAHSRLVVLTPTDRADIDTA